MQQLNERLKAATRAFKDAHARLKEARIAYTSDAGQHYAESIANAGALPTQIAEHHQAFEEAKRALEAALLRSGGQVTPEVKAALSDRRDAEDMIEQIATLEKYAERTRKRALIEASATACEYVNAYQIASQRWAEMNVLSALVDCGERIARAMAVIPVSEIFVPYAVTTGEDKTSCKNRVLDELDRLRDAFMDEDRSAYSTIIGKLDLGALKIGEILSPAAIMKVSEELRVDGS